MRQMLPLLAAAALAACTMPTTVVSRPGEGYQAIRFAQTVRLTGAVGNTWEFPVGTVLVADRTREADGALMYCGPMVIRDLVTETRPICVIRDGNRLRINTEYLRDGFERELPPGAIVDTRV